MFIASISLQTYLGIQNQFMEYWGIPMGLDLSITTLPAAESVLFPADQFRPHLRLISSKSPFILLYFSMLEQPKYVQLSWKTLFVESVQSLFYLHYLSLSRVEFRLMQIN